MKSWTQKDADAKHSLLGEISQNNELLAQLSEIEREQEFLYNNSPPTSGAGTAAPRTEDEVVMTTVVTTESADKGGSEKNVRASSGDEPTLEEASDITSTEVKKTEDDTKVETRETAGEVENGKEAQEGTADQAGPPDGGGSL